MSRVPKSIMLIINLILLAACGPVTPEPVSTPLATGAQSLLQVSPTSRTSQTPTSVPSPTPGSPTSTFTQTATRTTSPTAPASTSTPAIPTSSTTAQPDSVEQTQEAQAFCYQDPRKALDDYLTFLYQGEYEKAAKLYDTSYPFEGRRITPEALEPSERLAVVADFLRGLCEGYGTCLKHKIVDEDVLSDRSSVIEKIRILPEGDVMIFGVNFFYADGAIFESIPPFGVQGGRHTLIGFVVARLDGCFKNIDTPPITP